MATTDLFSALVIASSTFELDRGQETSGQAGGEIRVRELRSPLWRLRVQCDTLEAAQVQEIDALVAEMGGSIGSFLAWNPQRRFPAADPGGAILGASAVKLKSVGTDRVSLALKGLPAGYALRRGDMISFVFSTTRVALHRVTAASAVADGSGETAEFGVAPAIRTGAAVNDIVTLVEAPAEFRIVPGSYSASFDRIGSVSFDAVQVV